MPLVLVTVINPWVVPRALTMLAVASTIGETPRESAAVPDFTKFMLPPIVSTTCDCIVVVPLLANR